MDKQQLPRLLLKSRKASLVFRAFNNKVRQGIMRTLLLNGKPMTVTELYTDMKIEQSVASQHLGTLRRAGFVTCEREGKLIFYSINLSALKDMEQISDHISDTFKTQSLPTHRLHSL